MLPDVTQSAAHNLLGHTLPGGWLVIEKCERKPETTGGTFSVGYVVEREGRQAFLKALNILAVLKSGRSMIDELANVSNAHKYERDLFLMCKDQRLSKVNILLDHGEYAIPGLLIPTVPYLIFEKAERDARDMLRFADALDNCWKLRSLHDVAVGLSQLHKIEIAHHDVKPSNVFVFNDRISKIGDLGNSVSKAIPAPGEENGFAGDIDYSPPEIWYGYNIPEWNGVVFERDRHIEYDLITPARLKLPYETFLEKGQHGDAFFYRLSDINTERTQALLITTQVRVHNTTFTELSNVEVINRRKGYCSFLYKVAFHDSVYPVISDNFQTLPGSVDVWKKLRFRWRQKKFKIGYIDLHTQRVYEWKRTTNSHMIWGVPSQVLGDFLEVGDNATAILASMHDYGDISYAHYRFLMDNYDYLKDRDHVRLHVIAV